MDFANKAFAPLKDLFKSMTPAARITTALLLVVVVVSVAYLFRVQLADGNHYVLGGREFSQEELGAMASAFSTAGLRDWEIVGNRMRIPEGEKDVYLKALADSAAMPLGFSDLDHNAGQSVGIFSSRTQEAARQKSIKQQKLSMIVAKMPGIKTATVEYSEADGTGFPRRKIKTALVAVQAEGSRFLEEHELHAIQNAVVVSEAGLERENVAVLDMNRKFTHLGPSKDGLPGSTENIYAANKQMYESLWKAKIEERLRPYSGALVSVNVQLSDELNRQQSERKYDTKPVTINSAEITKSTTSPTTAIGGVPGTALNTGNSNRALTISNASAAGQTTEETQQTVHSVPSTTTTVTNKVGLIPTQVAASIGIPSSYYERVWHKRHPSEPESPASPDADELQEIRETTEADVVQIVTSLLKDATTGTSPPQVTVTTHEDFPLETIPEPSAAASTLAWFGNHWQTLAMLALCVAGLVVLRRTVHSTATKDANSEAANVTSRPPATASPTDNDAVADEAAPQAKLRRRSDATGPSLRDELSELVKEDPDAAANVLRNWIGDAA